MSQVVKQSISVASGAVLSGLSKATNLPFSPTYFRQDVHVKTDLATELREAALEGHPGPVGLLMRRTLRGDPLHVAEEPASLEVWTHFHEEVARLPDELRQVFNLLWYHEMALQEAADHLGISLSMLKRRWAAARQRLGKDLPG